jgi:hypothetical protein
MNHDWTRQSGFSPVFYRNRPDGIAVASGRIVSAYLRERSSAPMPTTPTTPMVSENLM